MDKELFLETKVSSIAPCFQESGFAHRAPEYTLVSGVIVNVEDTEQANLPDKNLTYITMVVNGEDRTYRCYQTNLPKNIISGEIVVALLARSADNWNYEEIVGVRLVKNGQSINLLSMDSFKTAYRHYDVKKLKNKLSWFAAMAACTTVSALWGGYSGGNAAGGILSALVFGAGILGLSGLTYLKAYKSFSENYEVMSAEIIDNLNGTSIHDVELLGSYFHQVNDEIMGLDMAGEQ